ncbi:pentapeptide repeat-containing protein [Actinomadura sp. WMMB 499]|nr:pentapeptide repeat-containing protein [Actinomadura sp. WMMB 499]
MTSTGDGSGFPASFENASFGGASFEEASFGGASFGGASVDDSSFDGPSFGGSCRDGSSFGGSGCSGAGSSGFFLTRSATGRSISVGPAGVRRDFSAASARGISAVASRGVGAEAGRARPARPFSSAARSAFFSPPALARAASAVSGMQAVQELKPSSRASA